MRGKSIFICVLCLLWMPTLWAWSYQLRWSYELALFPGFPNSLAIPLAIGKSAAVVLPFAVVYFSFRLDREYPDERMTLLRGVAYALSGVILFAAIAYILFTPAITGALIA